MADDQQDTSEFVAARLLHGVCVCHFNPDQSNRQVDRMTSHPKSLEYFLIWVTLSLNAHDSICRLVWV